MMTLAAMSYQVMYAIMFFALLISPGALAQDLSGSASVATSPFASEGAATTESTQLNPQITVIEDLNISDEYALAMVSIANGGRLSHCPSSGATYLRLYEGVDNMNALATSPPYDDITSPEDLKITYATHDTVSKVFPTTAILFTNQSSTPNMTSFRLYTIKLIDLVSALDDVDVTYKVELLNVTETTSTSPTTAIPVETIFTDRSVSFSSGTLMMDLIDIDDEFLPEERKMYTIAHMSRSGEMTYNADKFATKATNGESLVGAQGVLTLWLLGPFSIPLYPPFIVCCALSSLIWYLIQPFVFCCII